jgi:hypothetical protein
MRDLQNLVNFNKITGIKISAKTLAKHDSKKCQTCIMAKYRRSKLTKPRTPTDVPMHTLHSDIQGPFHVKTLAGGKYMISLICEATSKGGVSITKSKDYAVDEMRRMILFGKLKPKRSVVSYSLIGVESTPMVC